MIKSFWRKNARGWRDFPTLGCSLISIMFLFNLKYYLTMKTLKPLLILYIALTLSACGGGNSSSENSSDESTMVTEDGAIVTIQSTELIAGDAASVTYNLGSEEITGTIHWGDGHTTRIRGSGTVRHGYDIASSYLVGLQIDGGESSRIGVIIVSEPEPEVSENLNSSVNRTRITLDCTVAGTGALTSGGRSYDITSTPIPGNARYTITDRLTGERGNIGGLGTNPNLGNCPTGVAVSAQLRVTFPTAPSIMVSFRVLVSNLMEVIITTP